MGWGLKPTNQGTPIAKENLRAGEVQQLNICKGCALPEDVILSESHGMKGLTLADSRVNACRNSSS